MRIDELNIPKTKNSASQALEVAGYEQLGSGEFGLVFKKPGTNYVLKLFDHNDQAYLLYLSLIKKHQDNPHFPKIIGKLVQVSDEYYAVRMEELKPSSISSRELSLISLFCKKRASFWLGDLDKFMKSNFREDDRKELESMFKQYPHLLDALTAIAELKDKHSLWLDFKPDNIMARSGNDLVIIDPVV